MRISWSARVAMVVALNCGRQDSPPNIDTTANGEPKKVDTRVLELGAGALQDLGPVRAIDMYLDGFHVMKDDPTLHMEAHHYCKGMNEEFTQCIIFDGNTKDANIVGVEYIISGRLFGTLPDDEKASWHPHNFEILSGELVMPGLPAAAEKAALRKKMNSYGKTWHIWDTGHYGHPAGSPLPVGRPLLAWSYNADSEVPGALVTERDRRMSIDTADKRKDRADLAGLAQPQRGVDALARKVAPIASSDAGR